jgi:urocanate hydratase
VFVAAGAPEAARRLGRVLITDPGMDVVCHADAGYELAIDTAQKQGIIMPMLK